jgi:hypothetical protein
MEVVTTVTDDKGGHGVRMQRNSFPGYSTVDFWEAVQMWRTFSEFGFPDSGGTNDQGALWLDVVRTMKNCAKQMGVT